MTPWPWASRTSGRSLGDRQRARHGERSLFGHQLTEGAAGRQLHRDEVQVAVAAVVVDGDGVAVLELGHDRRLLKERRWKPSSTRPASSTLSATAVQRNLLGLKTLPMPP